MGHEKPTPFQAWLTKHDKCYASKACAKELGAFSIQDAWDRCPRADWMMEIAAMLNWQHIDFLTLSVEVYEFMSAQFFINGDRKDKASKWLVGERGGNDYRQRCAFVIMWLCRKGEYEDVKLEIAADMTRDFFPLVPYELKECLNER